MIYKLDYSTDKKITGKLGIQSTEFNPDYKEDDINSIYNYNLENDIKPLLPTVILNEGVPFTDFIKCVYFFDELIISEKVKNIFKNSRLSSNARFFKIDVLNDKGIKPSCDYFMFYYSLDIKKSIVCNKSIIKHYDSSRRDVKVIIKPEYDEFRLIYEQNRGDIFFSEDLVLSKLELDIFNFEWFNERFHYLSKKLVDRLNKEGVTGVDFLDTKGVFGLSPNDYF